MPNRASVVAFTGARVSISVSLDVCRRMDSGTNSTCIFEKHRSRAQTRNKKRSQPPPSARRQKCKQAQQAPIQPAQRGNRARHAIADQRVLHVMSTEVKESCPAVHRSVESCVLAAESVANVTQPISDSSHRAACIPCAVLMPSSRRLLLGFPVQRRVVACLLCRSIWPSVFFWRVFFSGDY